ncbi:uncharacterized protein LOC143450782 [Clavelina lepadiformis]|uniref:uncharacterized protein LOC143450782 n=1 Tax=Clavelina lepadiformis TaxID=159417 RepID=UPI004041ACE4
MSGTDDYGFLSAEPNSREKVTNVSQSDFCNKFDVKYSLKQTVAMKNVNPDTQQDCTQTAEKKVPWWKVLFKRGRKEKQQKNKLERRNSDLNLTMKSKVLESKQSRNGKCMSMLLHDNIEMIDDVNLTSKIKSESENQIAHSKVSSKMGLTRLATPGHMKVDKYVDISSKTTKTQILDNRTDCETSYNDGEAPLKHAEDIIEPGEEKNKQNKNELTKQDKKKQKPIKPLRKNTKVNILAGDNNKQNPQFNAKMEESNEFQRVLTRSRSMIHLRTPFRKKDRLLNCSITSKSKKSLSKEDILANTAYQEYNFPDQTSKRQEKEGLIDVYDRYPRKKVEQRKVLINMYTKEEIPVENGVPQWDSKSYEYATQRPLARRIYFSNRKQGRPTKFVESSFLGAHEISPILPVRCNTQNKEKSYSTLRKIGDMSILSLENEPGNLQLGEAHHKVEAQVHVQKETQMKLPLVEAKEKIAQKSALTENDHTRIKSSTVSDLLSNEVATSTVEQENSMMEDENSLVETDEPDLMKFGRSFILTGVVDQKMPDVIIQKHPYLAMSFPVRNMAQCLRHATLRKQSPSKEDVSENKAIVDSHSPQTIEDISNPAYCETKKHSLGWTPQKNCLYHLSRSKKNERSKLEMIPSSNSTSNSKTHTPCGPPRRCHSDSDLSSTFSVTPMKLNKYLSAAMEPNPFNGGGRKICRSRSARTDRLLTRMKHRIQRLERLSDLALQDNTSFLNSPSLSVSSEKLTKLESDNLDLSVKYASTESISRKCANAKPRFDLQSLAEPSQSTSLKKFKQLIHSRMDKVNIMQTTTQQHFPVKSKTEAETLRQQAQVTLYENLWPPYESYADKESTRTHPSVDRTIQTNPGENCRENTRVTFSSANVRPITSEIECESQRSRQEAPMQKSKKIYSNESFCAKREKNTFSCALSRSSVKIYPKYVFRALQDTAVSNSNGNKPQKHAKSISLSANEIQRPKQHLQTQKCIQDDLKQSFSTRGKSTDAAGSTRIQTTFGSEDEDFSTNCRAVRSSASYFSTSLLQNQAKIKDTMLKEMKRISTRYTSFESCDNFQHCENKATRCQIHGVDGASNQNHYETVLPVRIDIQEEARASNRRGMIRNVDTEEDGYATMSSNDSTLAQYGSVVWPEPRSANRTRKSGPRESSIQKPGHKSPIEYIIPHQNNIIEDTNGFLEWDCDETDL